jgi:lipid A 3-O-deacylase
MAYEIRPGSVQLLLGAALLSVVTMPAASAALEPSAVFAQIGVGDQQTRAYLLGADWDLPWRHQFQIGVLSGYFEGAFGRWTTRNDVHGRDTAWPTQISVTPVLRIQPARLPRYFLEIGVGANYIVPVFNSGHKRFSTEFNFGDHAAIGRRFGTRHPTELAVRVEHFSNAGIDHPNPGENFIQLRYSLRF